MKQHGAFKNVLTSILTHSMKFIRKRGVMCKHHKMHVKPLINVSTNSTLHYWK